MNKRYWNYYLLLFFVLFFCFDIFFVYYFCYFCYFFLVCSFLYVCLFVFCDIDLYIKSWDTTNDDKGMTLQFVCLFILFYQQGEKWKREKFEKVKWKCCTWNIIFHHKRRWRVSDWCLTPNEQFVFSYIMAMKVKKRASSLITPSIPIHDHWLVLEFTLERTLT